MDHDYVMSWSVPGDRLTVHLGNRRGPERVFDATRALRRHGPTRRELGRLAWRPLQTMAISAGIYRQALSLHSKGARFRPHPERHGQPPVVAVLGAGQSHG